MSIRTGHRWTEKPPRGAILDASHPLTRGLVAAFPMTEATGPSLVDAAGRTTATFAAGAAAPTWISGRKGPALDFVAASTQGVATTILATKIYTWSAWFKLRTTSGGLQSILAITGGSFVLLDVGNSSFNVYASDGPSAAAMGTPTLAANTWHHVALTRAGDSLAAGYTLYLDGVAGTSPSSSGVYALSRPTRSTSDTAPPPASRGTARSTT